MISASLKRVTVLSAAVACLSLSLVSCTTTSQWGLDYTRLRMKVMAAPAMSDVELIEAYYTHHGRWPTSILAVASFAEWMYDDDYGLFFHDGRGWDRISVSFEPAADGSSVYYTLVKNPAKTPSVAQTIAQPRPPQLRKMFESWRNGTPEAKELMAYRDLHLFHKVLHQESLRTVQLLLGTPDVSDAPIPAEYQDTELGVTSRIVIVFSAELSA
jgi:hypothetical protein